MALYHDLPYHLDLCVLAYHLHAQTMIWPLDPYMEQVAAAMTDRRDTFMRETHRYFDPSKGPYRGPGAAAGWRSNVLLDPLISRYSRLYPWRGVFVKAEPQSVLEGKTWLWHNTPAAITSRIRDVSMAAYPSNGNPFDYQDARLIARIPPLPGPRPIATRPGGAGDDRLYGFEGATGSILGSPGSWSLMGYCLAEAKGAGAYDVHIVFRGSRSGAMARAFSAGMTSGSRTFAVRARDQSGERHVVLPGATRHEARGNGDWVTDLDLFETVADPEITIQGNASRGFSAVIKSCIPNIKKCLAAIHTAFNQAPDAITVTGHSLGGALAAQFSSAMVCGSVHGPFGSKLPAPLDTWPWRSVRVYTMSAPVVGNDRFYTTYNSRLVTQRVNLGLDPVTNERRHYHVGARVHLAQTPNSSAGSSHELFNVRRSLLTHLRTWQDRVDNIPCCHEALNREEPWLTYRSFFELMVDQDGIGGTDFMAILAQYPAEFKHYLQILRNTMSQDAAYRPGHGSLLPWGDRVSGDERTAVQRKIDTAIALLDTVPIVNDNLDAWATCLTGIGGDTLQANLKLAMVLAAKVKGMTIAGRAMDLLQTLRDRHLTEV